MGKLIALLALAIVLILLGVGGFMWWQNRGAAHQLAGAEGRAGTATVAAGQADARTAAAGIAAAGETRDRTAAAIHEDNANALLQAPGAGQVLDPGFVQRLDDGLCRYAAYRDDPGCAGLRQPDPAQLSPTDPAGPAP